MLTMLSPYRILDRIGMTVSGLCGIHCALLPLVFVALPSLQAALYAFRDPKHDLAQRLIGLGRWEWLVVCTAIGIAAASMVVGYFRHHRPAPVMVATCGATLLIAAIWGPGAHDLLLHTGFAVSGGTALCIAHLLNLRVMKRLCSRRHCGEHSIASLSITRTRT
jgi:hypothetical protein